MPPASAYTAYVLAGWRGQQHGNTTKKPLTRCATPPSDHGLPLADLRRRAAGHDRPGRLSPWRRCTTSNKQPFLPTPSACRLHPSSARRVQLWVWACSKPCALCAVSRECSKPCALCALSACEQGDVPEQDAGCCSKPELTEQRARAAGCFHWRPGASSCVFETMLRACVCPPARLRCR